ncbi:trp operon leader peptide [Streptomyces fradiae]
MGEGRPGHGRLTPTVRHRPDRPTPGQPAPPGAGLGYSARMFAHSNQNWWWTAHPAAH